MKLKYTSVAHSSIIPPTGMSIVSLELLSNLANSGITPARCIACLLRFDRLKLQRASAPARATSIFLALSLCEAWAFDPYPLTGAFSKRATYKVVF
jgi:hypothetical protein